MRAFIRASVLVGVLASFPAFAVEDYFAVLGVARNNQSETVLDEAYRQKTAEASGEDLEKIAVAYATLKNPTRRAAHLKELEAFEVKQHAGDIIAQYKADYLEQYGLRRRPIADAKTKILRLLSEQWEAARNRHAPLSRKDEQTLVQNFFAQYITDSALMAALEISAELVGEFLAGKPTAEELRKFELESNIYLQGAGGIHGLVKASLNRPSAWTLRAALAEVKVYALEQLSPLTEDQYVAHLGDWIRLESAGPQVRAKTKTFFVSFEQRTKKNAIHLWRRMSNHQTSIDHLQDLVMAMGESVAPEVIFDTLVEYVVKTYEGSKQVQTADRVAQRYAVVIAGLVSEHPDLIKKIEKKEGRMTAFWAKVSVAALCDGAVARAVRAELKKKP